ncbi:MAG TPA: DUF1697 domain-containing protein [Burkholderiaceae bacterium]|nr:DUF1697 domain-containing protein [Burkholderiaceae bacterium]
MPRYVALLRGVSPMNAKMPELKRCFESAGFAQVKTVLASGNVAFDARTKSETALARQAETAMAKHLGKAFDTIVRAQDALQALIEADPYAAFRVPANAKRVVTFLREPHKAKLSLPLESDGVHILAVSNGEVLIAYVPNPRGPVFMSLIEKTFGAGVTTRTWDTLKKCAFA